MRTLAALLLLLTALRGAARADDRPDESSMFGAPAASTAPAAAAPAPAPAPAAPAVVSTAPARGRDDLHELLANAWRDKFASGEVPDNALQIGGLYYQRWIVSKEEGVGDKHDPITAPLQFDAFMDARPSDRVRGYVQERILYDATRDQFGNTTAGNGLGSQQYSSTSGAPQSLTQGTTNQSANNPMAVLDQAWLKFDLDEKVFVTAGKQHVKWGVSRFWNPTDFLSTQRRDPLLPYDLRLGNTMVKLELPLQRTGTNLYAITLFDNPQPASTLGQMGEAVRGETLIGPAEIGVEALARGGAPPTLGADFSSPFGPFDVYAEGALFADAPYPIYRPTGALTPGADVSSLYTTQSPRGPFVQVSGGVKYDFAWKENRQATLGVEYFYNELGYTKPQIYPVLIFAGQYQPFYTGRHYGAIYLTAEGPDELKHTSYTFSTIGNLSDGSLISRVDFSWRFLTYLTFEAYGDEHYGTKGGEFNFELNTPPLTNQGAPVAAITIPTTLYDLGVGLRLSF